MNEWVSESIPRHNIPLASSSGSIDDRLALLNLAETGSITKQQLIVSGGVKATDVDVAVALDAVLQALFDGLGMSGRGEHGRDRVGNGRILLEQSQQLLVDDRGGLGNAARGNDLLRGRSVEAGADHSNATIGATVRESAKERGSRGGLVGGVRAPTVLEPRSLAAALTVRGDTARRVRHRVVRNRQGGISGLNGVLSGNANLVGRLRRHTDVHRDRIGLVGDLLILHVVLVTSLVLGNGRVAGTRRQGEVAELTHDCVHVVSAVAGLMTMGSRAVSADLGGEVTALMKVALAVVAGVGDYSWVGVIMGGHFG